MAPTMFTVGHSTRSLPELVSVLQEHGVKLLVDVRSIPKSGMNPQFNKERLAEQLPGLGLQYMWLGKELGGLRQRNKSSELNAGWDNASFRGYADYMQCQDFQDGLQCLLQAAEAQGPAAYMCAEMMYFSCHRSLISDALLVRCWQVQHITAAGKPTIAHKLKKFAKAEGHAITYPAYDHQPRTKRRSRAKGIVTAGAPAAAAAAAASPQHTGADGKDAEVSGKGINSKRAAAPAAAAATAAAKAVGTVGVKRRASAAGGTEAAGREQQKVDVMLTRARAKQLQQQNH